VTREREGKLDQCGTHEREQKNGLTKQKRERERERERERAEKKLEWLQQNKNGFSQNQNPPHPRIIFEKFYPTDLRKRWEDISNAELCLCQNHLVQKDV
jgi:predicted Rossmann fold nucleotide-binding protein DprA/Smf involved in DNA uptake